MLRFISRTQDDFKSFVSFLNMKQVNTYQDNHTLHIILSAISDTTDDLNNQNELADVIIQTHFEEIVEGDPSDEMIYARSITLANSTLSNKVKKVSDEITNLKSELNNTKSEVDNLRDKLTTQDQQLSTVSSDKEDLKREMREVYIKNEIKKWRKLGKISIVIALILILFFFLQLFFSEWTYNYPYQLIRLIDGHESEGVKNVLYTINYALVGSIAPLLYFIYKRIISKKELEKFKGSIKIPQKYLD